MEIRSNSRRGSGANIGNSPRGARTKMKALFKRFVREEEGQDLIEYALLAGFISLVAILAIQGVGTGLNSVYNNINTTVSKIPAGIGS
jgi:pilus assembly protein Flp/PilA